MNVFFNIVSVLIISCLGTYSSLAATDIPDSTALALQQGKYQVAIPTLKQLSENGNATASYNLAIIYRKGLGVNKDSNRANAYYAKAAHAGLVGGYKGLTSNGIRPAKKLAPVGIPRVAMTPESWVLIQNPEHYTLQLASSTNANLIKKYYNENNLIEKAGYYKDIREGENWYALVYGSYSSMQEANAAIATLPEDLRKWSPWVRKLKNVQKIIRRNNT